MSLWQSTSLTCTVFNSFFCFSLWSIEYNLVVRIWNGTFGTVKNWPICLVFWWCHDQRVNYFWILFWLVYMCIYVHTLLNRLLFREKCIEKYCIYIIWIVSYILMYLVWQSNMVVDVEFGMTINLKWWNSFSDRQQWART